jgi:hypothetical protein
MMVYEIPATVIFVSWEGFMNRDKSENLPYITDILSFREIKLRIIPDSKQSFSRCSGYRIMYSEDDSSNVRWISYLSFLYLLLQSRELLL